MVPSLLVTVFVGVSTAFAQSPASTEYFLVEVSDVLSESQEGNQVLELNALSGKNEGSSFEYEHTVYENQQSLLLEKGNKAVMQSIVSYDGSENVIFREQYRLNGLLWCLLLFLCITFLIGGRTGVTSLLGLAVSILIIWLFIIPSITSGGNPLFVCLLGSYAIALTAIYLAHGLNKRTSVAVASTLATLTASALMAVGAVRLSRLFGLGTEEALFLQTGIHNINIQGLLLGGMIIGALGVLDDITTAQTAAIHEIKKANPSLSKKEVYAAAKSIGNEHIASLINTLALAYAGSALPLLVLFSIDKEMPLWVTLNSEVIAEEIVRTLVGSAALLTALPISTALAIHLLKGTEDEGGGRRHACGSHIH